MLNTPFVIASHYLRQQKGSFSFISKLAIISTALSVAVMLVTLAALSGFQEVITEKLYTFNGHIHVAPFDPTKSVSRTVPPIALDKGLLQIFKQTPHVRQAFAFAERPVIVQAKGLMEGLLLKGVDNSYRLPPAMNLAGNNITYPDSGYSRDVIISTGTADRLNIRKGDTIQIQFFDGGSMPRARKVRVSGLYHTGMVEVDKNFAICDIRLIQRLNNWTADSINAYQLDLENAQEADKIADHIHYDLINPPLAALTTTENYPGIFDWLDFVKLVSFILLIIMAVVAIINMGAVMVILIIDRTAMIGLLKSLGMNFTNTVRIFLNVGALLGGVGILAGNALALLLIWIQQTFKVVTLPEETYSVKYAQLKIVWWHFLATDIACLILVTLCMWLPATYIRKIQPAQALQFR